MDAFQELWAVVLAGGEGTRLKSHGPPDSSPHKPKQFRSFNGKRTLLHTAMVRAAGTVPLERTVVVVSEKHRRWWREELAAVPAVNILSQPENRGTASAILLALLHIRRLATHPIILILPSDHEVEEEGILLTSIRDACYAAHEWRGHVILLGMPASAWDTDYGWILPAGEATERTREVSSFVERPTPDQAMKLTRDGALLDSFILAASGAALTRLYETTQHEMLRQFTSALAEGPATRPVLRRLYSRVKYLEFGRDLLEAAVDQLRVLPVPPCGWIDLGTPDRVEAWSRRQRELKAGLDTPGSPKRPRRSHEDHPGRG